MSGSRGDPVGVDPMGADPAAPDPEVADPEAADPEPAPPVRVLGIRHHGPGSARALARALTDYAPDCVLIEGPADADDLVDFVPAGPVRTRLVSVDAEPDENGMMPPPVEEVLDLDPPVALLAHAVEEPARAAFWPLASFSPEWQALTWARSHGASVHFMDLPSSVTLAARLVAVDQQGADPESDDGDQPQDTGVEDDAGDDAEDGAEDGSGTGEDAVEPAAPPLRTDPIGLLAQAAGYDDPEAWWEDVMEMRRDGADPFDALGAAMTALREAEPTEDRETLIREAHMRRILRKARKQGFARIAVICGAYHVPALTGKLPAVSGDNALLTRLPKTRTQVTWVPWTHERLAFASGYGAGVVSPGWYHHLFVTTDEPVARWLTRVAGVLREEDLPVSSAHIIEATRLADTLATLRGRPMPGLPEVTEATWSVLCDGSDLLLDLVTREAVVGQHLGRVPDGVPTVPLEADLRATAKRLRLPMTAKQRTLILDLRKPTDLGRSRLLHRMCILQVDWGEPVTATTTGTFKEAWQLQWRPELAVALVDAAAHGTTLAAAAGTALVAGAVTLSELTAAVEQSLLAELPQVLPDLLAALDDRAAHETDLVQLLHAVVPLARTQRYGDVRRTDTERLTHLAESMLARACAGLVAACAGLAPEPGQRLRAAIDEVHTVIALLPDPSQQLWSDTLTGVAERADVPGVIAGRLVRLLFDGGSLVLAEAIAQVSRTLSRGTDPVLAAHWIEAFLAGSPLLLVHHPQLLRILDAWVADIGDDVFVDVLPMVRRAFGAWTRGDRQRVAAKVANLNATSTGTAAAVEDFTGTEDLLALVGLLLGGPASETGPNAGAASAESGTPAASTT
ncbi:MAG: DUF5682 family protein [Beutenbergiaceae bacterium]